jgi:peptidoglycan/LPS O-acetylase OafA/YrhL
LIRVSPNVAGKYFLYKSLQAGRAFAAIFVVLFHLGQTIAAEKYFGIKGFSIPFSFGSAGVEFFFVLSGFIIFTAHRHEIFKPERLVRYIKKRLVRIYPTYWIVFLVVYIIALSSSTLRNSVPQDIFVVLKSLLLLPQNSSSVGSTGAPVIIVAWTLQYEMFFYSFFALMILSKWLSVIGGIILMYIYVMYAGSSSTYFPLVFLSSDLLLLFAFGMMVSAICKSQRLFANNSLLYAGIGLVMFSFVALDKVLQIDLFAGRSTILYGLASSFIIFGLVRAEDSGCVVGGNKLLQLLGDSSYALYLIHTSMISVLCKLAIFINLNKFGFMGALFAYSVILCSCLISSVAFHLWIERPLAKHIQSHRINRATLAQ